MTKELTNTTTGTHAALLENIKSLGALLDDIEDTRKANGNRIGALERRLGGSFPHLVDVQEGLIRVEHDAELQLVRFWRKHPVAPWAKAIPGCGEKLIARLVAEIGEPSLRAVGHWEKLPDGDREWVIDGYEERTAGQLLAYCGHGDPARRIPRDATQEEVMRCGNPRAKVRAYLIGAQFKRTVGNERAARSPYRDLYDEWRERYAEHVHEKPCVRCGPSGKPAPEGSPWSKAHQDAAAIRNTAKRFLIDLWCESRRLRGFKDHAAEAA